MIFVEFYFSLHLAGMDTLHLQIKTLLDVSSKTFDRVDVPYPRYSKKHVQDRFPQFQVDDIEYAFLNWKLVF